MYKGKLKLELIHRQVYGTYQSAPYTTTIFVYKPRATPSPPLPPPERTTVTRTEIWRVTTTASKSAACNNFSGACVVYGGSGSKTVYVPASTEAHGDGVGNGNGYIGMDENGANSGRIDGSRQVQGLLCAITGLILVLMVL